VWFEQCCSYFISNKQFLPFPSLFLSFLSLFTVLTTSWSSPALHPVNYSWNLWTQIHNFEDSSGNKIMRKKMKREFENHPLCQVQACHFIRAFHTSFVVKSLEWSFYWWTERVCTKSRWWWVMETIKKKDLFEQTLELNGIGM